MKLFELFIIVLVGVLIMLAILATGNEIEKSLRRIADELHKLNKLLRQ